MATMKEVASLVGVSVATVSRVLNNSVHYIKKESKIIGLTLPDITNPFFPQLAAE